MLDLYILMTLAPKPAWNALAEDARREWLQNIVAALSEHAVPTPDNRRSGVLWSHLITSTPPCIAMLWVFVDPDAVQRVTTAMMRPDVQEYFTTYIVGGPAMSTDDIFKPFLSI